MSRPRHRNDTLVETGEKVKVRVMKNLLFDFGKKRKRPNNLVYQEADSKFRDLEEVYSFLDVSHPPRWRPKGPRSSWKTGQRAGETGIYINQHGEIATVLAYSPFRWAETKDGEECGYWKLIRRLPSNDLVSA